MATLTITARPDAFEFGSHQEYELREALKSADRNTIMVPIGGVQDVLLNADTGQTVAGYNYSDVALAQVASAVAPGLVQVVLDISGQWRKTGEDPRYYSGSQAVEIFNRIVKLRFDRKLAGMQFICDTKRKVIDGLVGARYRYLSNSDFYERVRSTYDGTGVEFLTAMLYGRQLVLRYKFKDPKLRFTIADDPYALGFHFSNTEIGGRSVRTASLVVHEQLGCCALGPYRDSSGSGRVVHSGRSFERRLHMLLTTMVSRLPFTGHLRQDGEVLESKFLNLGGDLHDRVIRHCISVLRRRRFTLAFAQRVVASMCTRGRYVDDTLADRMPSERKAILASRTYYDLFVAVIREAGQHLPLDQREAVEHAGYQILTGKIVI